MTDATELADLVRRGYAAFNDRDIDTLTEIFDENATWHTPGQSPVAGDHKGRNNVFTQFGRYGGETDWTFKATLKDVLVSEDGRAVGLHHNSGERNGKQLDTDCCIVFEIKDGRVISGREHFDNLYNWDDFWA